MYNIMNNSKTGMLSNQGKIDIVSNNIINANTTGYKRLEVGFLDLYTETLNRPSYPNSSKNAVTGTGAKISQAIRNFEQGSLKNTEIKSNLAIDGEGFFRVIRNDGSYAYTRNGEFNIDRLGRLVDDSGNILEIEFNDNLNYNNVDLSSGELSINKLGEVFLDNNKVGSINIYTSTGDNDFISAGESLFIPSNEANIQVSNKANIMQGYIEISNVNMQNEMTELIIAQRSFQFNSRGLQAVDDMWSMVNNLKGR